MKSNARLFFGVFVCLSLAVGAVLGAKAMMDSLYAYRSPLHANPPAPAEPLSRAEGWLPSPARRVVFVLVDALREDTSLRSEVMPFLNELRQKGAWATMHSRPTSLSQPGYTTLFTGAWPDLSDGPVLNLDYAQIPAWTQDNLFSAARRAGLQTAVSGFNWFERLIPGDLLSERYFTAEEDKFADHAVVDAALPWLDDAHFAFVSIHLDQVDFAGHHEGGPRDPRWNAAARRCDDLLQEIVAALDLKQDTLLVTSDHGQIERGGHGGTEAVVLTEPFVLVGAGVRPGHYPDVQMVDVAPTLSALLGLSLPASAQGRVLTEMLTLTPRQMQVVEEAEAAQQSRLAESYLTAIGVQDVSFGERGVGQGSKGAIDAIRLWRLPREQLPRTILALIIGLFPLLFVIRRVMFAAPHARKRSNAEGVPVPGWALLDFKRFVVGALFYLFLFNLRYAGLERRTYSLSSLRSAEDLLSFLGVTVLIALLPGWLLSSNGLKAWRLGARQAAEASWTFILTTLYFLLLPALWSYSLNGAVASWTLPHFPSMFLAFFSLLQITFVVGWGLILTAVCSVIISRRGIGREKVARL